MNKDKIDELREFIKIHKTSLDKQEYYEAKNAMLDAVPDLLDALEEAQEEAHKWKQVAIKRRYALHR